MSNTTASNEQARQQLSSLRPQSSTESKAGRIRQLLPDIESAMQRGITQSDIVNALANAGIHMTLDELRNALYRARRQQRKAQHETPQAPAQPRPQPAPAHSTTPSPASSHPASTTELWLQTRDNPPNW